MQPEENRIADILQSALVAHGAEVNRCFERALADTLDVSGKIELAVDVGAAGKITKAEPALDEVKSPVLLACLRGERAHLVAGGDRSRQHGRRAAGLRGAGGAVHHQGRGRARSRAARAQAQGGRRGAAGAAVLGQAAGRRGDDARAEGGGGAADRGAGQPDRAPPPPGRRAALRAARPRARAGRGRRGAREAGRGDGDLHSAVDAARDREHGAPDAGACCWRSSCRPAPRRSTETPRIPAGRAAFEVLHDPKVASPQTGAEVRRRHARPPRRRCRSSAARGRRRRCSTWPTPATAPSTSASWRPNRASRFRATRTPAPRRSSSSRPAPAN